MTQDNVLELFAYRERYCDLDYLYEILFKADVDVFESVLSGQDARLWRQLVIWKELGRYQNSRHRSKRSSENVSKVAGFLS